MEFNTQRNELIWKNLNLEMNSPYKKLLENVSGSVGPCTMTALMGPSGAGKTTLLNAIAGRIPTKLKLTGEILLNNHVRDNKTWPRVMGYVEQDFICYEYQTVYETLVFTNKVKGTGLNEDVERISNILGLTNLKSSFVNELSGGERKRLSIGVELLGNPPILFLDEPTSGLDSYNAINILELLKKLTEYGKTILVTIHQPSYKQIEYFSKILLLSQGGMVYEGTVKGCLSFFNKIGYIVPVNTNPTDFFLDTVSLDTRTEETLQETSKKIRRIKNKWTQEKVDVVSSFNNEIQPDKIKKSQIIFFSLFTRNITDYFRKTTYLKIKVVQKVVFFLIFGLAYLRMGYSTTDVLSRKGAMTFVILNLIFGVCQPIFNVFPAEKSIIVRERRSGMYSGSIAYLSKYLSECPFNIVYEVLYVVCLYWIIEFNSGAGRFFICLIIVISVILWSLAFGLTISSISPTQNIAQISGSTFTLLFVVYSGAFGSTSTIPSWLRWLIYISPAYYGYTALIQNQLLGQEFTSGISNIPGSRYVYQNGTIIVGMWWCVFLLWLNTLIWIVLGCLALEYTTSTRINLEKTKDKEDESV